MALQFILGDLTQNKKEIIIKKLLDLVENNPETRIFYIVPDHLKFDMEELMLKNIQNITKKNRATLMNIQVVSFKRLGWYLLDRKNLNNQSISDMGISMLLRQVLNENKRNLQVYKGQVNNQGFIDKIVEIFNELIDGEIEPDDFQNIIKNQYLEYDYLENKRLEELVFLYGKFYDKINDFSLNNYKIYELLEEHFSNNSSYKNDYIVIDHHYFYNAQQLSLIFQMAKKFNTVWLTLPILHHEAIGTDWSPLIEIPRQTYQQIKSLASYYQVDVSPDWEITNNTFPYNENIKKINEVLRLQYNQKNYVSSEIISENHELWINDSIQTELLHVSNQINSLVKLHNYRYKDILILARNLDTYEKIVDPYFAMNNIPYFMDNSESMIQHSFVKWLNAFFNINKYNWKYEDIFELLKTQYFYPSYLSSYAEFAHQVAILENIVLANGYENYRFYNLDFEWIYPEVDSNYINYLGEMTSQTIGEVISELRSWIVSNIYNHFKIWKQEVTGHNAAKWIYQTLDDLNIIEHLKNQRDSLIELGDLETARHLEQVWNTFNQNLTEFNLIYKNNTVDYSMFTELVISGLSMGKFHIIPPTLDQVTFSSIDSPQVEPRKICFILGVDQVTIPNYHNNESLLTDDNRTMIQQELLPYQNLQHRSQTNNLLEILTAYQVLTYATDLIFLSYINSNNNESLELTPFYKSFTNEFKIKKYYFKYQHFLDLEHESNLGNSSTIVSPIIQNLRYVVDNNQYHKIERIEPYIFSLFSTFTTQQKELFFNMIKEMFIINKLPKNLSKQTALQLYGKNLIASVSKIETYYQDPFTHFLIHGLKIKEREYLSINPATAGSYYHDFLDTFMKLIINGGQTLNQLSNDQINSYYLRTIEELNSNPTYLIFNNHPRFIIIKKQMDSAIKKFINLIAKQSQYLNLYPYNTEAHFGYQNSDLKETISLPLLSGGNLLLTGKIDRIDLTKTKKLFQIIDYKSGKKTFDLTDIYYGLEMQLLTYAAITKLNYPDAQPLGAFYQPMVQTYEKGTEELWRENSLNYEILNKHKYKGFITLPASEFDEVLSNEMLLVDNPIHPLKIKKDGSYDKNTIYFNEDEQAILTKYICHLFKNAGNEIQSGNIELHPFYDDETVQSINSKYRVITGFDATENYYQYRYKTIKKEKVISEISNKLLEEDANDNI